MVCEPSADAFYGRERDRECRRQSKDQVQAILINGDKNQTQIIDDESYSEVLHTISQSFSALQTEMEQKINEEGSKHKEFRGATVNLGSTYDFKFHGKGKSTDIEIHVPSIAAQAKFKKTALWGLVKLKCTVNISTPDPTATGNLNPATGAMTNIYVKATTTAKADCDINLPIINLFLDGIIDHIANKFLDKMLKKINTAEGIPLSSKNFAGLNKLLKSRSFILNGKNLGDELATNLENLLYNNDIRLSIHNVKINDGATHSCMQNDNNEKTLLTFNVPTKRISLTLNVSSVLSRPGLGGIYGANNSGTNTPVVVKNGSLTAQVKNLQQQLEQKFQIAPSIIELVYESSKSDKVASISRVEDSALFTGIYLASQCFRESASNDPKEKVDASKQVQWALNSVENLFKVTGEEGLLARFAFDTNDPDFDKFAFLRFVTAKNGWVESDKLKGWVWLSSPSRDQYTGVLFGLGVCNQLTQNSVIRAHTSNLITTAVAALERNNWKIPLSKSNDGKTANNILSFTQTAWIKLAALASENKADRDHWESEYKSRLNYSIYDPFGSLKDNADPSFANNYVEYYTWNLGYLRMYPLLEYEKDPTYSNYLKSKMIVKYWNETYSHQNAEFTFIKIGTMGAYTRRDQIALNEAISGLSQLAFENRRNNGVDHSQDKSIERDSVVAELNRFLNNFVPDDYRDLAKVESSQAKYALPMLKRPYANYMWEISPFLLSGEGNGDTESPSVDVIFAYWLGRYHKILSEQY